jgi:sarcosine oxidase, subunit gamma
MLEGSRLARRTAALPLGGEGPVRVLPAASRLSVRARAGAALPAAFAMPINRCTETDGRLTVRLGPDEWLAIGPEADAEAMAAEFGRDFAGRSHAIVDVSHRNVAFAVTGAGAEDILNAGCPLDLHPKSFPEGAGTRTVLAKAEIVLLRTGDGFRVECWRSFAPYVHGFLGQAAQSL